MVSLRVPMHGNPPPSPAAPHGQAGRLWTRDYVRVLALQMCFGLSYSAFLLLPKYLSAELRSSATEIGWVTGAALVVAAVAGPLLGSGVTRIPKRWILFSGLVGSGLAALAFASVDRVGPLLYGLRILQGLAFVAVFNSTAVLVADRVDSSRLGQAIGYLGLSMLVTNALAPAVTEPLADALGWGVAFSSAGVLALVASLGVLGLQDDPVGAQDVDHPPISVADRRLLATYYASALVGVGLGVMFTFTQPFALQLGAARVGDFFFGYVGAAVFMRTVLARLADRVGAGRVAVAALLLYSVVVFATARLSPPLLAVLGIGLGAAHGLIYPALTAFALGRVSPRQRGPVMGWFAGCYNAGFAASVLCLGPVADRVGFPVVFLVAGALVLTGVQPLRRAVTASAP